MSEKPAERPHRAPTDTQRDERVRLTIPLDEALERLLVADPETAADEPDDG